MAEASVVVCKDCGQTFFITAEEQEWLDKMGFAPYKRCKECRKKRREQNQNGGRK